MTVTVMIVFMLICLCIIGAIVISLGVGIGYALSALLPGVNPSLGIVAGAIFSIGIIDLFLRLMAAIRRSQLDGAEQEDEPAEPFLVIPSGFLHRRSSSGSRKSKK